MKIGRFSVKKFGGADDYNDPPRPFMEHLIDLRDCLLHCAIAWALCEVVIIPFAPKITEWLIAPAGLSKDMVQGLGWTAGFSILMKIMLWGGTALSLPFLLFFVMRFVFPGLKRSERSIIVFCLFTSTLLFGIGVWMAYAATLEIAIQVLQQINAWVGIKVDIVRLDEHVDIVIKTIIAFGLAFQLPLLLLVLGWIGLIPSEALRSRRRIAIVAIFVIAMILTPPDPVSQILMALPMCVLYEGCIWIIRLRELARRDTKDDEPSAPSGGAD
ncbi:MAG TPA: twin-arginine translocase subunit TatC [Kiritimatiellia bacterium]|nr:twin-arginine translocase subunit TatC [Kiritimatiellia bacterium]HRU71187.1 twin-arginine translocase subunit TatC [Kiritimatiellia bacterium]